MNPSESLICHDCGTRITPFLEPRGVIYVRELVDGKGASVTVCTADFVRRRGGDAEPHRMLWAPRETWGPWRAPRRFRDDGEPLSDPSDLQT